VTVLALGTIGLGIGVTSFWIVRSQSGAGILQSLPVVSLALTVTLPITLLNVGLRWVRWHFLTRRAGAELRARDSLLVYVSTLPALVTPFYVGELIRAPLLGRKYPRLQSDVVAIWFLERSSDLLIVSSFVALTLGRGWLLGGSVLVWGACLAGIRAFYRVRRRSVFPQPLAVGGVLGITALAWLLPGLSLALVMRIFGEALPLGSAIGAFSYGTIIGGLSGLPLGTGITGSSMITLLENDGVQLGRAVLAVATFRAGTAWIAVVGGAAAALLYRARLGEILRPGDDADHFDLIAEAYEEEIPTHVRDRLLVRKVGVMQDWMQRRVGGGPGRALDMGCGPGWYACEMARLGYEVFAIDQSAEQVGQIQQNAEKLGVEVSYQAASAAAMPFPDDFFDVAYAINVAHHIIDLDVREKMFREIVRVLKPGGVFFLHEINTLNPIFRFYMGYVFPLIREIDEGTEKWIHPARLPRVTGARWQAGIDYLTFLPDFLPQFLTRRLIGLERFLERSPLQSWSAHYVAKLVKEA
jgi:SAM-dependent methyltransferase